LVYAQWSLLLEPDLLAVVWNCVKESLRWRMASETVCALL